MERDPVCRMEVTDKQNSDKTIFNSKEYFFCSTFCKVLFEDDPGRYLKKISTQNDSE